VAVFVRSAFGRAICELCVSVGTNVGGSDMDLILGTILAFACRDWERPWKRWVVRANFQVENRKRNRSSRKQLKCPLKPAVGVRHSRSVFCSFLVVANCLFNGTEKRQKTPWCVCNSTLRQRSVAFSICCKKNVYRRMQVVHLCQKQFLNSK
jgi:hypothetical protein